jgi:hypothetical protein
MNIIAVEIGTISDDGCIHIPKYLISQKTNGHLDLIFLKDGLKRALWLREDDFCLRLENKDIESFDKPVHVNIVNEWIAIVDDNVEVFNLQKEEEWKVQKSRELLQKAKNTIGNPIRKLNLLSASGSIVGLDVAKLVGVLETKRKSNESLTEVYDRIKKDLK